MRALLFDVTKCLGCDACTEACCEANGMPGPQAQDLCDRQFTVLKKTAGRDGELNCRRMCMHCLEPACVSACPVGSLRKTAAGPVVYDADICMGCRYCMQACPFHVPCYEWASLAPRVRKCVFCSDRLAAGKPNACVEACPAEASICGEREQLLKEARARLAAEPGKYVPKIYGEHDAGGTSVLVLSPVPFGQLGLPEGLPGKPLPALTYAALSAVPAVAGGSAALLTTLWWFTGRKARVAREEGSRFSGGEGRP